MLDALAEAQQQLDTLRHHLLLIAHSQTALVAETPPQLAARLAGLVDRVRGNVLRAAATTREVAAELKRLTAEVECGPDVRPGCQCVSCNLARMVASNLTAAARAAAGGKPETTAQGPRGGEGR